MRGKFRAVHPLTITSPQREYNRYPQHPHSKFIVSSQAIISNLSDHRLMVTESDAVFTLFPNLPIFPIENSASD